MNISEHFSEADYMTKEWMVKISHFIFHLLIPNVIEKKITRLHDSWTIGVASFKLQRAIAIVYLDNKLCSQRGCRVKQMLKSPRNNITVSVLHEGVQLMSGSKRVDI